MNYQMSVAMMIQHSLISGDLANAPLLFEAMQNENQTSRNYRAIVNQVLQLRALIWEKGRTTF